MRAAIYAARRCAARHVHAAATRTPPSPPLRPSLGEPGGNGGGAAVGGRGGGAVGHSTCGALRAPELRIGIPDLYTSQFLLVSEKAATQRKEGRESRPGYDAPAFSYH